MFETLPTLGVGVSLSLSAKPDPVALAAKDRGPAFIEYSGVLDVERVFDDVQRLSACNVPVLYHPSYINFCGTFSNNQKWLQATDTHIRKVNSPWFAQDLAYCFWGDNPGYSSQFGFFIPPLFNQCSMQLAVERIKEVQQAVSVPVAIEPPPVTFVVGDMPLFEFIGKVSEAADCAILLDVGHLVSFDMATQTSVMAHIEALPLHRVIELHIAGGRINKADTGPVYIDAHDNAIEDETWAMLDTLLPLLPNVKALCYECEGVEEHDVLDVLDKLRDKVLQLSASERLVATVKDRHS